MAETVTKHVQLTKKNVDKFYDLYGSVPLTWALDMLLEKFVEAHEITPADLATIGAKQFKELLARGKSDSVLEIQEGRG